MIFQSSDVDDLLLHMPPVEHRKSERNEAGYQPEDCYRNKIIFSSGFIPLNEITADYILDSGGYVAGYSNDSHSGTRSLPRNDVKGHKTGHYAEQHSDSEAED